jgi:hypothetical protein
MLQPLYIEREKILTSDNSYFVWEHKAQTDVEGLDQAPQ